MSRQTDLENNIRESYDLIHQYESIVRLSSDPKEKARVRRNIQEQWGLIQEYLEEYGRLDGNADMPDDIAQIAARVVVAGKLKSVQSDASQTLPRKPFEPEMILIPAGEFWMGEPPRQEYLPAYYIAKTPTTNIQYLAFVQAGGKRPKHWKSGKIPAGKEQHPVVHVSWYDAVAYCDWLSQATAKIYRLPTEQEWEKAARGTDGRAYPWGNVWQDGLCNVGESGIKGITPVGRYSPRGDSPYGCVDMAGNVWEWTDSWYDEDKNVRVVRGGSWYHVRGGARCAARLDGGSPDSSFSYFGFRCVSPVSPSGS